MRCAAGVPLLDDATLDAADLQRAIQEGLLEETHYLELKRELAPGKQSNHTLACALAALAVDGGTLLVGIEEDMSAGTLRLTPQPLDGLRERVESVAGSVPDPALLVVSHAIPSRDDATVGYLVVQVPPSPTAPHMVDGRYPGRGDTQKRDLSDVEVRRLHQRRRLLEDDALELLELQIARDPIPADERTQAHLFLIAEPTDPRPDMMQPALDHQSLLRLVSHGGYSSPAVDAAFAGRDNTGFSPDLDRATRYSRRADGAALSHNLSSDRVFVADDGLPDPPEDLIDLEVTRHGGLRITMTRLSDGVAGRNGQRDMHLFDDAAVIYTLRLVGMAAEVANRASYLGDWLLAVGATGLHGLSSHHHVTNLAGVRPGLRVRDRRLSTGHPRLHAAAERRGRHSRQPAAPPLPLQARHRRQFSAMLAAANLPPAATRHLEPSPTSGEQTPSWPSIDP